MPKATIRFLRTNAPATSDDVIHVHEEGEYCEMFRLTYRAAGWNSHSEFFLSHAAVLDYVSRILKTMGHDADPFEYVQVETAIHPSILYHASDIDDRNTRDLIRDILDTALRRPIDTVKH